MRISYHWLKNYLDTDLAPGELARLMTGCGLEVEETGIFQSVKGGLEGVVIGEVLTCTPHPDSDHLSLTTVHTGESEPLRIVCGATNVAVGQKVAVATAGTKLFFGEKEIVVKKSKIRGAVSEGMICAEDELGLGSSHEGIMVLDPGAVPGTPARDYFRIEEDTWFGIGLTPNRVDAASHVGVARDLAALLPGKELRLPDVSAFQPGEHTPEIEVEIGDPMACPRYSGITIRNVRVAESPRWLINRLLSVGLRPINNIVDITNFILYELGQPLHAFDAARVTGKKIIIKKLPSGTRFVTLDGIERALTSDDLMICNAAEPMCIAGVFGGIRSGVTENTTDVFLESACFDPRTIRKTARHHGLQTDASFRFERGADWKITVFALKRAAQMILEIAGGEIPSGIVDVCPNPLPDRVVILTWKNLDRLSGFSIGRDAVKRILVSLGFTLKEETPEQLVLTVPSFKVDITREADVIEEVLRIYGYDAIAFSSGIRSTLSYSPRPDRGRLQEKVSEYLSACGFYEIMNNSLTRSAYYEGTGAFDPGKTVRILNPISRDLDALRQSLLFGGLETIRYNQNRKIFSVRLYEFGTVYSLAAGGRGLDRYREETRLALFLSGPASGENWNAPSRPSSVFDLKGYVYTLLGKTGFPLAGMETGPCSDEMFEEGLICRCEDGEIARFGSLAGTLLQKFDSRQEIFYGDISWDLLCNSIPSGVSAFSELPRFPEVRRDLALLVDRSVTFGEIEKLAFLTERKVLKKVGLFDVYEGEGIDKDRKSYAVSFVLQDTEKTLTESRIDSVMESLMNAFRTQLNAVIR